MTSHPEQETMHKVIVVRGQKHYIDGEYDTISTYLPTKIIGDDTVVHTVTDEQLAGLKAICDNDSTLRLLVLVPPQTEEFQQLLQDGMRCLEIQRALDKSSNKHGSKLSGRKSPSAFRNFAVRLKILKNKTAASKTHANRR